MNTTELRFLQGADVLYRIHGGAVVFVPRRSDLVNLQGELFEVLSVEVAYMSGHMNHLKTMVDIYLVKR